MAIQPTASASSLVTKQVDVAPPKAKDPVGEVAIGALASVAVEPSRVAFDRTPLIIALLSRSLLELGYHGSSTKNLSLKMILVNLVFELTPLSESEQSKKANDLAKKIYKADPADHVTLAGELRVLLDANIQYFAGLNSPVSIQEKHLDLSRVTAIKHLTHLAAHWDVGFMDALKTHLPSTDPIKEIAGFLKERGLLIRSPIILKDQIAKMLFSYASRLGSDSKDADVILKLAIAIVQEEPITINLDGLSAENKAFCMQMKNLYEKASYIRNKDNILGNSLDLDFFAEIAGVEAIDRSEPLSKAEAMTLLSTFSRMFEELKGQFKIVKENTISGKKQSESLFVSESRELLRKGGKKSKGTYLMYDDAALVKEARKRLVPTFQQIELMVSRFDALCLQFEKLNQHLVGIAQFSSKNPQTHVLFLKQIVQVLTLIVNSVQKLKDSSEINFSALQSLDMCLNPTEEAIKAYEREQRLVGLFDFTGFRARAEELRKMSEQLMALIPSFNESRSLMEGLIEDSEETSSSATSSHEEVKSEETSSTLVVKGKGDLSSKEDIQFYPTTELKTPFVKKEHAVLPTYLGPEKAEVIIQQYMATSRISRKNAPIMARLALQRLEEVDSSCERFLGFSKRLNDFLSFELKKAEELLKVAVTDYDTNFSFEALLLGDEIDASGSVEPITSKLFDYTQKLVAHVLDLEEATSVVESVRAAVPVAKVAESLVVETKSTFGVATLLKTFFRCSNPFSRSPASLHLSDESSSHLILAGVDLQFLMEALSQKNLAQAISAASMLIIDTHVAMEQSLKVSLLGSKSEDLNDHSLLNLGMKLDGSMLPGRRAFLTNSDLSVIWARYPEATALRWKHSKHKPALVSCFEDLKSLQNLDTPENQCKANEIFLQLKSHLFGSTKVVFSGLPKENRDSLKAELDSLTLTYAKVETPVKPSPLKAPLEKAERILAGILAKDNLDITTRTSLREIFQYLSWLKSASALAEADLNNASIYWVMRLFVGSIDKLYENLYIAACRFHGMGDIRSHNLRNLRDILTPLIAKSLSLKESALIADFNVGNALHYSHQHANPKSRVLLNALKYSLSYVGVDDDFTPSKTRQLAPWKNELAQQVAEALNLWSLEAEAVFVAAAPDAAEAPANCGAGGGAEID